MLFLGMIDQIDGRDTTLLLSAGRWFGLLRGLIDGGVTMFFLGMINGGNMTLLLAGAGRLINGRDTTLLLLAGQRFG